MKNEASIPRGYYRLNETAVFLGVSKRTVRNLMHAGKIPYTRLTGRLVLFRVSAIDAALEKFQVGGQGEQ